MADTLAGLLAQLETVDDEHAGRLIRALTALYLSSSTTGAKQEKIRTGLESKLAGTDAQTQSRLHTSLREALESLNKATARKAEQAEPETHRLTKAEPDATKETVLGINRDAVSPPSTSLQEMASPNETLEKELVTYVRGLAGRLSGGPEEKASFALRLNSAFGREMKTSVRATVQHLIENLPEKYADRKRVVGLISELLEVFHLAIQVTIEERARACGVMLVHPRDGDEGYLRWRERSPGRPTHNMTGKEDFEVIDAPSEKGRVNSGQAI